MKINKKTLDQLIMEVITQTPVVSANPLQDSPNPQTQTTIQKPQQPIKPEQKIDPSKVQVDKAILSSLFSTKEKLRRNMNKLPANQLVNEVSTLLNQLNFLDTLKDKM